jgi:hypothetical protein
MPGFTRFDPRAFLEHEQSRGTSLAGLAALAGAPVDSQKSSEPKTRPINASLAGVQEGDHPAKAAKVAKAAVLVAPARWHERVGVLEPDEPAFTEPFDARRGRVERRAGVFLHFCIECGRWGSYGYGVGAGRSGRWYCAGHRPETVVR